MTATTPSARWMRLALTLSLLAIIAALTMRGRVPVAGAGVYYDDGVYAALGHSLATGNGYVYENLPGRPPGVKYPPLYPALLAVVWKLFPDYPANLGALKAINVLLTGLAAALAFLLFTRRSDGPARLATFASVVLLGYGSWQMMALGTALLAEPLFLVFATTALLLSGRQPDGGTARAGRDRLAIVTGLTAAAAFLTRGIGLTLVAAILVAAILRRGRPAQTSAPNSARSRWLLAASALIPVVAWTAWSRSRAAEIPQVLLGPYGSYAAWYQSDAMPTPSRLAEIASAHWTPLLANLQYMWIPDASAAAAVMVLTVLVGLFVAGTVRIARRNPALAAFPPLYLLLVMVWPYEPDRFFYAILPLVTLLVVEGAFVATERLGNEIPRWGPILLGVSLGLLLFNGASYQSRAQAHRAWARFQTVQAFAYAPLNAWIRANVPEDAVVASGLDPYVFWETGRTAVPAMQYRPSDYGRYDASPATLARDFEEIITATGASWAVVVQNEGKSGRTIEAFAARHPDRIRIAFEQMTGPYTGVVYEVLAAGKLSADPPTNPPSPQ